MGDAGLRSPSGTECAISGGLRPAGDANREDLRGCPYPTTLSTSEPWCSTTASLRCRPYSVSTRPVAIARWSGEEDGAVLFVS